MIGGKFTPLTIMNNVDIDLDSLITTFKTAVTETASEILGKHRQEKNNKNNNKQTNKQTTTWVTAYILDLCDRRRELRKKRFEFEGSEKYREVNNNIKRCMNRANGN